MDSRAERSHSSPTRAMAVRTVCSLPASVRSQTSVRSSRSRGLPSTCLPEHHHRCRPRGYTAPAHLPFPTHPVGHGLRLEADARRSAMAPGVSPSGASHPLGDSNLEAPAEFPEQRPPAGARRGQVTNFLTGPPQSHHPSQKRSQIDLKKKLEPEGDEDQIPPSPHAAPERRVRKYGARREIR